MMRISCAFWMMLAAFVIGGPANGQEPSNADSSDSDAVRSEDQTELFSLKVKEDGYDITFAETERGENYSLATVELNEGTSVGSSMFIMRCVYEIAKRRDFEYFVNADQESVAGQDENVSVMKIYFTNDESVPLKELVGDDYSEDLQEVYDDVGLVSISMFAMMFDVGEFVDALPSGEETAKGLYINSLTDGGEEITVEETERGTNFSVIEFGVDDDDSAMENVVFLFRCLCELATLRGFDYFVMVDISAEDEFPAVSKMYFTDNADASVEELLGEEDSEVARAQLTGFSPEPVSELCGMFDTVEN